MKEKQPQNTHISWPLKITWSYPFSCFITLLCGEEIEINCIVNVYEASVRVFPKQHPMSVMCLQQTGFVQLQYTDYIT